LFYLRAKNYQSWWKFDQVLEKKTILHSFFGTRCSSVQIKMKTIQKQTRTVQTSADNYYVEFATLKYDTISNSGSLCHQPSSRQRNKTTVTLKPSAIQQCCHLANNSKTALIYAYYELGKEENYSFLDRD